MTPLKVGIIGCGNISGIYLDNLSKYKAIHLIAVSDRDMNKAHEVATSRGLLACTVDDLLNNGLVELVVNLTTPDSHYAINSRATQKYLHTYCEKPLALNKRDGVRTILRPNDEYARNTSDEYVQYRRVGCAPDTFLGASHQTCREIIDKGLIGEPIGVNAYMMCHGHESWHPSPKFYYEPGGGPLFDMGPYYLTALVNLLGPISHVQGKYATTFKERRVATGPNKGSIIDVQVPTHILGLLEFESGVLGQITTSFDVWHHTMPHIEIYGTEGSLQVPDPNGFGGEVKIRHANDSEWLTYPVTRAYSQNSRGLGVLDMAYAIRNNRPHRASGTLALHVLDVMESIIESGKQNERMEIANQASRPTPLPAETPEGELLE
jgi:predicted dehydrogenase